MESSHRRWPATARTAVLTVVLLLAFGAGSAHALVVPTVVGTSQADAIFAQPVPGQSGDQNILNHLETLIINTPRNGSIRAAIHSLSSYEIADALVRASQEREVDVEIVYPQNKRGGENTTAVNRLDDLGTNKLNRSWVHWCNHNAGSPPYGDGCISTTTGSTVELGGTMHSKFFLFSATGQGGLRKWVTWFGSANLTQGSGAETWNDGLTVYDNQALYNAFEQNLFTPMKNQTSFTNNDFGRYFSVPSAGIEVHASPDQGSDIVNDQTYNMGAGCTVLVATTVFSRTEVAHRLADMKRAGCQVNVLVGLGVSGVIPPTQCPGKPNLGGTTEVFDALRGAGIPVRAKKIHDKLMLLYANNKTPTVLTGSHNLTKSALRYNDEILVEVAGAGAYGAFSQHWWQAWGNSCAVNTYNPNS